MDATVAPVFADLARLRSKGGSGSTCSFDHGQVWFKANRVGGKANIEVDLWRTRDLSPSTSFELWGEFCGYLALHPKIRKGDDRFHFGPTSIHFHVRVEDADIWLRRVFDTVSNENCFVPCQTAGQAVQQTLDEIVAGIGPHRSTLTIEEQTSKSVATRQVERIGTSRIGQSSFSEAVRSNYQHRCCFPGCTVDHDSLLVGAHIARWSDEEGIRGDVSNGLCLCALHDKAFEFGMFVLTDEFFVQVVIDGICNSTWVKYNLVPSNGMQIVLGKTKPSIDAVRAHRKRHGLSFEACKLG